MAVEPHLVPDRRMGALRTVHSLAHRATDADGVVRAAAATVKIIRINKIPFMVHLAPQRNGEFGRRFAGRRPWPTPPRRRSSPPRRAASRRNDATTSGRWTGTGSGLGGAAHQYPPTGLRGWTDFLLCRPALFRAERRAGRHQPGRYQPFMADCRMGAASATIRS